MRDTLIIGLGHPLLSDDALGLHALTMLTGRPIPAVEYLVGGQDLYLGLNTSISPSHNHPRCRR